MKYLWLTILLALVSGGCTRSSGPAPLTVEQIPAAIQNAFREARPLLRQNADSISTLIKAGKYAAATIQIQAMLSQELSDAQRDVVSAALQALLGAVQQQAENPTKSSAATGGTAGPANDAAKKTEDAAAAVVMEQYIRSK
jgi:hypothetical protein